MVGAMTEAWVISWYRSKCRHDYVVKWVRQRENVAAGCVHGERADAPDWVLVVSLDPALVCKTSQTAVMAQIVDLRVTERRIMFLGFLVERVIFRQAGPHSTVNKMRQRAVGLTLVPDSLKPVEWID